MTVKFTRTTSMKTPSDTVTTTREVVEDVGAPGTLMIQNGTVDALQTKEFEISFHGNAMSAAFISSTGILQIGINGPFGDTNDGELEVEPNEPFSWLTGDLDADNPFHAVAAVASIHVTNAGESLATLRMDLMAQTWND